MVKSFLAKRNLIFLGALWFFSAATAQTDASWEVWFRNQIMQHPAVLAAEQQLNSITSFSEGRGMPLYNPGINGQYDTENASENFTVGLNQTLDIRNKRSVRQDEAFYNVVAAQQAFELTLAEKTAEALVALAEREAARDQAILALQQEEQISGLLQQIEDRRQAGDLGQIDAELSILGLSQRLNNTAQAQARLAVAEASLRELLPGWTEERSEVPEDFWDVNRTSLAVQLVDNHPAVRSARAQWEALQKSADLAQLRTKPDPTVGISAGRIEQQDAFALNFSIPLYIRNDFSAYARSAREFALSAEAAYLAVRRKQQYAIQASLDAMRGYETRVQRWRNLMQSRGESAETLLEAQWQSGDITTTEYLLGLQQLNDGLSAGIELMTQYEITQIQFLLDSGQIIPVPDQTTQ